MDKKLDLNYLEDVITYSCLRGKDCDIICPTVIEYVNEHTFLRESNKMVMDITRDFYIENNRIPTVSEIKIFVEDSSTSIEHFKEFLRMSKSFSENLDIDRMLLIKYIEEFLKQRLMTGVLADAFVAQTSDKELDMSSIQKRIDEAMGIYLMDDIGLMLFDDSEEYIDKLLNEETRISTGFKWLDEQLGGGLLASGSVMYQFCAASNIGKSNFIKSMASNISKGGKNVLVVSLEMPRFIYANRFVAEMADLPIGRLKEHTEDIGDFLEGAKEKGYGDVLIKDFATGSITPQGLLSFINRAQNTLDIKFDAVFIDYPELLKPSRQYSGRHDLTIAQQYIETRAISFTIGAPVVSVAQLNRDAYGKDIPSMSNIGGAIGIIQCSDFGGFLYATDEMKSVNQIGLTIAKSRFGPVNKIRMYNVCDRTLTITESSSDYTVPPDQIEPETSYLITDDEQQDFGDMFDLDADKDDDKDDDSSDGVSDLLDTLVGS